MNKSSNQKFAQPSATALTMIAILTVLWGVNFPSLKLAVSEFPPWTFRVLCVTCGAIGLLGIGRLILGHSIRIRPGEWLPIALAGCFNITGFQMCVAFALMSVEAGRGAIVAHTMPLWATIFAAIFLREKLTVVRSFGLIIGLSGLIVLIGEDIVGLGKTPVGTALLLGAAISWGAGTVIIKSRSWTTPIIILTGWQFIMGGIPIAIGMIIFEWNITYQPLSQIGLMAVLYSALVPMIVCHLLWYTLIGMLPTAIASISTLAIPLVGVYSSAILLEEKIGIREWVSLALVALAISIVIAPSGVWFSFRRKK
ncbi:MAG: DMT family transporter [Pseudomonadota bacterium]|nr:DMT family transporter [Pseudomonadota bacterium]